MGTSPTPAVYSWSSSRHAVSAAVVKPSTRTAVSTCVTLCTAWMVLGSWVAFVPGTLERAFGFSYNYQDTWGVSFARFEAISAGIVVLIAVLSVVGYALGAE